MIPPARDVDYTSTHATPCCPPPPPQINVPLRQSSPCSDRNGTPTADVCHHARQRHMPTAMSQMRNCNRGDIDTPMPCPSIPTYEAQRHSFIAGLVRLMSAPAARHRRMRHPARRRPPYLPRENAKRENVDKYASTSTALPSHDTVSIAAKDA